MRFDCRIVREVYTSLLFCAIISELKLVVKKGAGFKHAKFRLSYFRKSHESARVFLTSYDHWKPFPAGLYHGGFGYCRAACRRECTGGGWGGLFTDEYFYLHCYWWWNWCVSHCQPVFRTGQL